ncbi:EamA family transporter [Streptomyces yunnanensis]|uniref:Inner membrane transporter RhtA n=1 Tax=Streptomyces yunnanensis TaxID=156453 RepID=A0A9X8MQS9_9ACTN|nr:EamA family transporter [Streptomyces yunnanensis]SHL47341.1 inner membrane transporter RhtA [Streptomyces yunnanensis]
MSAFEPKHPQGRSLSTLRTATGGRLRLGGAETGLLMAVASMTSVQLGLALAVPLFGQLGALGTAGLRLAWGGLLMLVLIRPRLRSFTRQDLLACTVLGAATAGMMLFFMLAVAHLPLGTASALEFLGPLAVSLYGQGGGRKLWTALAALGVLLLTEPWHGGLDAVGLACALAAAGCWAVYILLTQRVGDRVTGLSGLAVSMPVAGLLGTLIAAPTLWSHVTWQALGIMLVLAAVSPVLPFALEFLALRRLTTAAFGTLMSLEPAIALLIGLLVLGQTPGLTSAAGVLFVVIAGAGAIRTGARESVTNGAREAATTEARTPEPRPGAAETA